MFWGCLATPCTNLFWGFLPVVCSQILLVCSSAMTPFLWLVPQLWSLAPRLSAERRVCVVAQPLSLSQTTPPPAPAWLIYKWLCLSFFAFLAKEMQREAQSTLDARANSNANPLMLLACSVNTPIHAYRFHLLCVALRVLCGWGLNPFYLTSDLSFPVFMNFNNRPHTDSMESKAHAHITQIERKKNNCSASLTTRTLKQRMKEWPVVYEKCTFS